MPPRRRRPILVDPDDDNDEDFVESAMQRLDQLERLNYQRHGRNTGSVSFDRFGGIVDHIVKPNRRGPMDRSAKTELNRDDYRDARSLDGFTILHGDDKVYLRYTAPCKKNESIFSVTLCLDNSEGQYSYHRGYPRSTDRIFGIAKYRKLFDLAIREILKKVHRIHIEEPSLLQALGKAKTVLGKLHGLEQEVKRLNEEADKLRNKAKQVDSLKKRFKALLSDGIEDFHQ